MKRILLGLLFALAPFGAYAQTASAVVVSSCGTPPTTYTAGQMFPLTVDTTGKLCDGGGSGGSTNPIYVTGTPVAPVTSTTTESSHVLKSSAGSLDNLTITVGATSGWLMLFDATSAPADGAVTPAYYIPVASSGTNGYAALSWSNNPLKFTTGIVAVFSSTGPFTKTASATAQFSGQVQ